MFKEFFMKKMLESQLKDVPEDMRQKIVDAVEKNPELFAKIGARIEEKMKNGGGDKMALARQVAEEFKSELAGLIK